ncbi:MAG TPA: amino acid permease [Thermoanaerobaculia bacterium]|nr:amino acid permease [Thermoanaerobaculia bacterium]
MESIARRPDVSRKRRLKKELGLLDVYAVATGTTLSGGFFLLPGLAAETAGPALVLAYLVATLPLLPATFSLVELSTAMPRAGGLYYFLDRSLGPAVGTVGGLGTWIALMLKVAFALVGMGAYIALFVPNLAITPVALVLAVVLGGLNLAGAKNSGRVQVLLTVGLLAILTAFIGNGVISIEPVRFRGFLDAGGGAILSTAGFVYVSYLGISKVASLSEEVRDPERNLPLGVFLALATVVAVYALGTLVMTGVIPAERLAGDLTPVATAAEILTGRWGMALVSVAALLSFLAVANAGILSASRYPLAMGRDRLLPRFLGRTAGGQVPRNGIVATVVVVLLMLLLLDPVKIAKLASAFMLFIFALLCLAVIVMRESRIDSYDPSYRSPLYPWLHLVGLVLPFVFIARMGALALGFSAALVLGSALWYAFYGRHRVNRGGALLHLFARLGQGRDAGLDPELRSILKEKGAREDDPFDDVVAGARLVDVDGSPPLEEVTRQVSDLLAEELPATSEELQAGFLEGNRIGATPVAPGVSLPHLRLFDLDHPVLVMVRSRDGIDVEVTDVHGDSLRDDISAFFFLVSPEDEPRLHLRILAQIAERVDDDDFMDSWLGARNEQELKEILLRDERYLSLHLRGDDATAELIGRPLAELELPDGVLVALVKRRGDILIPRGGTVLEAGDRVTVLGADRPIREMGRKYRR